MNTPNHSLLDPKEKAFFRGALMEGLSELVFAFTLDGELVDWNAEVAQVTGYSEEEISMMRPIAFIAASDRRRVRKMVGEVIERGRAKAEARLVTKDDRQIPYEFTGTLLSPSGRTLICGTGRNISEGRQRERELGQSERRYRRLFEEAKIPVSITNAEGRIIDMNPAGCELLGYTREELIGREVNALHVDPSRAPTVMNRLDEEGGAEDREVHLRRKDGEVIICELSSSSRVDPYGQVEAYQTFLRDVTEERRIQKALRESEEKFRTLAEKALIGIALLQEGVYKYVNPALAQMFGYVPQEIIGKSPKVLFHPADWPSIRRRLNRRFEGDMQEAHYEARVQTKTGETRIAEVLGSRMMYREKPAIIGTVQDITERRELQREILEIQENERRRLGQDLHDGVGSQLSGISMLLRGVIQDAQRENSDLVPHLEQIKTLVQESSEDVRRISRGLNPVNLDEIGLAAALERLARNTATENGERSVCEVIGDVPDLPQESAMHLYWIAQEAVTNARKYAEAEHTRVELAREEGHLLLTVTDNGRGFDTEKQGREGLGLRTMRYRAEVLGGTLEITSEVGEGTTVCCRLRLNSNGQTAADRG